MQKRLYRSSNNKVVAGVCGGLGEYFDVDPVLVRIIAVLLFLAKGIGIIPYVVGWILMPKQEDLPEAVTVNSDTSSGAQEYGSWNRYLPGFIFIAIGIILLLRDNVPWFDWGELWPILLVLVGLVLIFRRKDRHAVNGEEPVTVNGETHSSSANGDTPL